MVNKYRHVGALVPFELNTEKIRLLREKWFLGAIQEMMAKPTELRNSLELCVIQALQALGRAMVAPTVDMRFLGCVISLERILISDGEETTTESWSDRLAVALATEPIQRKTIIARAKNLYNVRSKIVHAGYCGVSDADARMTERWALGAIWRALSSRRECASHDEFCNLIDPRKIGLGIS